MLQQNAMMLTVAALLFTAAASADVETRTIEYEHDGVTLEGYLAWDGSTDQTRPGVLIIHEWWGHDDYAQRRAREIAELGYAAFALDMYGQGVRTDDAQRAQQLSAPFQEDHTLMRSRARAGLDVFAEQDIVDPDHIAAMGYCFGGTVALQLVYDRALIQGAVSFHGSLPAPAPGEAERIDAPILVLHGAEDPLVPDMQVARFKNAMDDGGVDWQFISYGHAVHSFTNPAADGYGIDGAAYHETSDRRSWQHMKLFFEEIFDPDP